MIELANSPAEVVRALMIDLSVGTDPPDANPWPVYVSVEPSLPDNCQTVYDTTGQADGRSMLDGELWYHYGFQVRVRAVDHPTGWAQVNAVRDAFAMRVFRTPISVGAKSYLVQAITHIGPVLPIGFDAPKTKRLLFTLNCMIVFADAHAPASNPDQIISIMSGGIARTFQLHLPIGFANLQKVPLFVMCCGGGGSGSQFATQTGMSAVADALGFAVAYPNPVASVWTTPVCFNSGFNDVQFVARDLPAWCIANQRADINRVYMAGFSNGAKLCWKAWREASDVIAAFAAHSGDIGLNQYTPAPVYPRPFLYLQGETDTVNPPAGGIGPDDLTPCNHASEATGVLYGAQYENDGIAQPPQSLPGYTITDYVGQNTLRLVSVANEGHNWTGGVPIVSPPNQAISNAFSASQMVAEWCLANSL